MLNVSQVLILQFLTFCFATESTQGVIIDTRSLDSNIRKHSCSKA